MSNIYEKSTYAEFTNFTEKDIELKGVGYSNWNNVIMNINDRMQSFYSIFLVVGGSGVYEYDNKSFSIGPGQMFVVFPGVNCTYHYDNEATKWEHFSFEFTGECAKNYLEMMGITPENPVKNCENYKESFSLFKTLFDKQEKDGEIEYYDVLSAFYKLISYNIKRTPPNPQSLSRIIKEYINSNYKNPRLTVKNICDSYKVNPSYMSRTFRQDIGFSMKSYIINLRIAEAILLLRDTKITAKEIAYAVGFSDEIHFLKTFKKCIGMTPKQYRQLQFSLLNPGKKSNG